ncbi:response regulator transcription factor [Sorangium sp. So ce1014]|uniref:response regulator transcription factor n=1 Tax=Sorangium sp. So ce1014 TaxID=3133326 RepID=UPI003F622092
MADPPQILVIDDDAELCELLAELLGQEGYAVESARDAISGLARAQEGPFTLVVLDVMLPGLNGFEVLTRLRRSSRVAVLMLTARGEDVDRIVGLEMGADDYLPKPFNPRELVARVRALHRRASHAVAAVAAGPGAAEAQSVLTVDDLEVFPAARRVRVRGEEVRLTTAEYDLIEVLVRQAGAVVSREDLARRVLGRRLAAYDRGIDMHVSNLRRKLGPGPSGGERIKTVRNAGYILAREGA